MIGTDSKDIIEQRAFGRRASFNFGEDKVEFQYVDPSGDVSASAFYEAIELENPTHVRVKTGGKYSLIALFLAFIVFFAMNSSPESAYSSVPLFICAGFTMVVRFTNIFSVRITILGVKVGSRIEKLRIINDAKLDEIMKRIRAGWVARIRKLYATVRIGADPAQETQRFRWMLDQKVIDAAEFQRALTIIGSATAQPNAGDSKLN